MASADIKNMYLNVKLAEQEQTYFGFSITDTNGETIFYVMTSIPFGYAPAAAEMEDLIRPLRVTLHKLSVDISFYIDDSLNVGRSVTRCGSFFKLSLNFLGNSGWIMAAEKLTAPTTKIYYLGFFMDSVLMRVFASEAKIANLIANIDLILDKNENIHNKQMAAILGSCAHLLTSHHNYVRIATRACQHLLGQSVESGGWDGHMDLNEHTRQELNICKIYLKQGNGNAIRRIRKDFHIVHPAQSTYSTDQWNPNESEESLIKMVSDSSSTQAFVFEGDQFRLVREYPFDLSEVEKSSTFRELAAVSRLFTHDTSYIKSIRGATLVWITDSQSLVHILTKGSRVQELQKIILNIVDQQIKYGKRYKKPD